MNVLLLGSGGREHALAWKIAQSPRLKKLYCIPGSAAIGRIAECTSLDASDALAISSFSRRNRIDLVVIGPEAPLAAGVADALRREGIKVFGPNQAAARLESSKAFAKDFMTRHKIPTASWKFCSSAAEARAVIEKDPRPWVVKADGLAAGKGVRVCGDQKEALNAVSEFMESKKLGGAGRCVVLESCLEGPELSVMMFCDGKNYRLLPPSRDHKRLKDNDQGPNTGGMGAYAPVAVDKKTWAAIKTQILDRVLAGLAADKLDYRGLLYAGLMLTKDGPMTLEFNCRFGDPETQAVLPLLKEDLLELALACAEQKLAPGEVALEPGACVCLTVASPGYPGKPVTGKIVKGLPGVEKPGELMVFHAGTINEDGRWTTCGGRVLGVTALGADIAAARNKAYAAVSQIQFDGMHYRKDIGASAIMVKQ